MSRPVVLWLSSLLVVIVLVVAGMNWARRQALATYGTASAQEEWESWRKAAAEQKADQASAGLPAQRQIPKSMEPPALVLMRDHFGACLGAALVAAVGVYGVFVVLLRGALRTNYNSSP